MGEGSFQQCSGYAGLEEVGGERLVLVAWEVSSFVFFNLRVSLKFWADIGIRRDSLQNSMSFGFGDIKCLCGTFHVFSVVDAQSFVKARLRCAHEFLAIQPRLFKTKEKCKFFYWFLISR